MMTNLQEKTWAGQFGKDYTDRCTFHLKSLTVCIKRIWHKQGGDEHQVFIGIGA